MKLIQVDGLDRDSVEDILIEDNLPRELGEEKLKNLLEKHGSCRVWFKLVDDDYRLKRGMEDLV